MKTTWGWLVTEISLFNEILANILNKIVVFKVRAQKRNFSFTALLWFVFCAIGVLLKIRLGYEKIGNFLIFKNAFWHTLHQANLYSFYPSENLGSFLYGPIFVVIIAPFSLVPVDVGAFLWGVANAAILFYAIRKLPVSYKKQNCILLLSVIEMMTSVQNMQTNCIVAALVILSFGFVQKQQDFWAALFIALGFLVKLYGIVGIAFILFSEHKTKFAVSFLIWLVVLFCLPMILSSPSFIVQSYLHWYQALLSKNDTNAYSDIQNISVMGMITHIFKITYLNPVIIFIAGWFYLLPFFRINQLKTLPFQVNYLAFTLIGVVIFSSSAESPTYIIASAGVSIWFILQNEKKWHIIFLLLFTFTFTTLSSTDYFPGYIKFHLIRPYSLKALPCFFIWVILIYQLLTMDFRTIKIIGVKI